MPSPGQLAPGLPGPRAKGVDNVHTLLLLLEGIRADQPWNAQSSAVVPWDIQ